MSQTENSITANLSNSFHVSEKIVAVVVTYNRLSLLPKTLQGIQAGELHPDQLVIINNASDDGTDQYLENLHLEIPTDIVRLEKNVGGAGGFTVGIDRALMRHHADLVWIMDDDTEPLENTLSELYRAWSNYGEIALDKPALVASRVVWTNGEEHPMNTMRTKFGASAEEIRRAEAVDARPIRSASFVSIMMDAQVMRREGLPLADFFIWNDDFEYSTRLINHRIGIATSKSTVLHHTKTFGTTNANPGPRFYNDVRNKLWVFTRRRTLACWEKVLYGGSTARLWGSTILKTEDKTTYSNYLKTGMRDGFRSYQSNAEVLSGVYDLEFPGKSQVNYLPKDFSDAQFSVLMATYAQENPEYLDRAISSNTVEQSVQPDELVLVKDGQLTPELDAVIEKWQKRGETDGVPLTIVAIERNLGLARALNEGLKHVSHDIVARADSDDISLPKRFENQLPAFLAAKVSALGGAMEESDASGQIIETIRHAVTGPNRVKCMMDSRNPLFHPTVMFLARDVQAVGGYEYISGAEDYWLWARMSREGFTIDNIDIPLVRYRAGAGAFLKRGGFHAFKQDLEIQSALYRGYIISPFQFTKNLGIRAVYRSLPTPLRAHMFRKFIGGSRGKK